MPEWEAGDALEAEWPFPHPCPVDGCGRSFDGEHGLKIHTGKAHPETLPWRNERLLRRLYVEEGLTTYEIAERFGCGSGTIKGSLKRCEIDARPPGWKVATGATHSFDHRYERWLFQYDGEKKHMTVHQLLACLNYNPHEVFADGTHVHHKSGHGFDNRPDNLQVLPADEHQKLHHEKDMPVCKHRLIQSARIMEEERA